MLDFMRLLWALDHGLQTVSKRMEATLGVTGPQRLVVRIVGRQPGISAGAIATTLYLDPSTLTGILQRLQTRGFLERKKDPTDARRAMFRLTLKGKRIDAKRRTETVEAAVRNALARLSPEKISAARDVLSALAITLESPLQRTFSPRSRGARSRPRVAR